MDEGRIIKLTVNYMEKPLGLESESLVFGWQMQALKNPKAQKAYQLRIGSPDCIWDSGRVEGAESVGIRLPKQVCSRLIPGKRYDWQVTVWTQEEEKLQSEPSWFELGATGMEAWERASFICMPRASRRMPVFRAGLVLSGKKVQRARLYMSAIGVYQAWINGKEAFPDCHMNPGYGNGAQGIAFQTADVTGLLAGQSEAVVSAQMGTGWYDSEGRGILDAVESRPALKGLLVVEYEDGSRQELATGQAGWAGTLDGPVTASGVYYGEDYDAGRNAALGAFKETGYTYESGEWIHACAQDRREALDTVSYPGRVYGDPASTGKLVRHFNVCPQWACLYTGTEGQSELEGGEIRVDAFYALSEPSEKRYKEKYIPRTGDVFESGIALKKGQTMIVNMGQNMTAVPRIRLKAGKGVRVSFRFGEMLNDGSRVNPVFESGSHDASGPWGSLYTHSLRKARAGADYTAGTSEWEEYRPGTSFFGYQYVQIQAEEEILVGSLCSEALSSVTEQTGFIVTDNQDVNRLFTNTLYGQLSNYFTMITDCPQRDERMAWTGDAQVFCQTALYHFNTAAFQNAYQDKLAAMTRANGYPAAVVSLWDYFDSWAAGWSDVVVINAWTLYRHTGDRNILERNWDAMNRYMDYLKSHERASYQAPATDRNAFGDWLAFQGTGYEVMADYCYGYTALLMHKAADVLGDTENGQRYRMLFDKLKETFLENHVTEEPELIIRSGRGSMIMQNKTGPYEDNSQTALLWMLKLGWYRDERMKRSAVRLLVDNIRNIHPREASVRSFYAPNSLSVGFLGANVIAPVLTENGFGQTAYDLLLNTECPSWLFEVKCGATTVWERWNSYDASRGFGDCEMNSFNHFSYGAICEWMYAYMAGIRSDEALPGFRHILLQPVPDTGEQYNEESRISHVDAAYESVYGRIESEWRTQEGELVYYRARIPANTTATLYLPVMGNTDIYGRAECLGPSVHNGMQVTVYELVPGEYCFRKARNSNNFKTE